MKHSKAKHNKGKIKVALFFCLFIPFLLSGCYDSVEVDEEVYALALGVDPGVNKRIRLTIQYVNLQEGGGGGDTGGAGIEKGKEDKSGKLGDTLVTTIEAPSLLEALMLFNTSASRRISLSHSKMFIFSEDFVRGGVSNYLDGVVRYRQTREFMRVVVCRGSAEEFLKENQTLIGQSTSKSIELMLKQSQHTGYFPDMPFKKFYIDIFSPYGQAIATYADVNDFQQMAEREGQAPPTLQTEPSLKPGEIPRKGGSKREHFGTAVFRGDKMVGSIDQNQTKYYLLGIGRFEGGHFMIENPKAPGTVIVLSVKQKREPRMQARLENGRVIIDHQLKLVGNILTIQSRQVIEAESKIEELEEYVSQYLQQGLEKTVKQTQQMESDIFHYGKAVAKLFRTIPEFEAFRWIDQYGQAEVHVEVDVDIQGTGAIYRTQELEAK